MFEVSRLILSSAEMVFNKSRAFNGKEEERKKKKKQQFIPYGCSCDVEFSDFAVEMSEVAGTARLGIQL